MDVQFDGENSQMTSRAPVSKKGDWADKLVARGIVKTRAQGQMVLIAISVLALVASFMIVTSNATPTPDTSAPLAPGFE
jgi:hypothetical protein